MKVLEFFEEQIAECERSNKGLARRYATSKRKFAIFLKQEDIPFSSLSRGLIKEYEAWLAEDGVSKQSSSFYLRNLRAVYNKAVKLKYARRSATLFNDVYTGVAKERKQFVALNEETIVKLLKLELTNSIDKLVRDIFVFSYCARGMALVDIAFLKKTNISNGQFFYVPCNAKHPVVIQLEPCIKRIIDNYVVQTKGKPYVFPILTITDAVKAYQQYEQKRNYFTKKLGRISNLLGCETKLTFDTPRHSWAHAANGHKLPVFLIGEGLGISSEVATQEYLNSIEVMDIHKVNHIVLDALNEIV